MLLALKGIRKVYRMGEVAFSALKGVDLEVEEGEMLAIMGPSGSGKSTLLHILGLLDRPTEGEYVLMDRPTSRLAEDERAFLRNRFLGFVFQAFNLVPTLTALENVLVPVELRGQGGAAAEEEACGLLARVGLGERRDHYPVQLSGGEQQRVALARAFMNRPKILFCDEPTGNLDGDTAHAMADLIFRLNEEKGTTLVLVTHDLELARRCRRILRLKAGAVASDETV